LAYGDVEEVCYGLIPTLWHSAKAVNGEGNLSLVSAEKASEVCLADSAFREQIREYRSSMLVLCGE
jgi:hypothetical protein